MVWHLVSIQKCELYAQKKEFGKWKARNNYRPDFHLAGNWSHRFGLNQNLGHGGSSCNQITTVYSTWDNGNNSHNFGYISPISNEIIPANGFAWQYEYIYPHGEFKLNAGFCELLRITQMDVNVHAIGDGGGNLDLVRHLYTE